MTATASASDGRRRDPLNAGRTAIKSRGAKRGCSTSWSATVLIGPNVHPGALTVGMFFHTYNAHGAREWQGQIDEEIEPNVYRVQLFSWIDGRATDQRVVTRAELGSIMLFADEATWRRSGECLDG